jgi:hypothetical protein
MLSSNVPNGKENKQQHNNTSNDTSRNGANVRIRLVHRQAGRTVRAVRIVRGYSVESVSRHVQIRACDVNLTHSLGQTNLSPHRWTTRGSGYCYDNNSSQQKG